MRRGVQRIVDRRFNRARYDADRIVAAFAARLQDAVDLDAVRDDLAGTVQAALEPVTCRCGQPEATGERARPPGASLHPVITAMLAALVVALVGVLFLGAALAGELSAKSFWSASGVLVMVLVIAAVGLVVVRHQPHNPIGWLLAGESVFILLVIVAGFCATLMYRHGHHGLLVVGPAVLALSQLFSYSLIGFPLVILLFPDGRLPSRRWRWAMWAYLASTATVVLVTVIASVGIAMGQHVAIDENGNLVSLGRGGTAWLVPMETAFFIAVAVFWLAAVGRQVLAWRGSTGERRQQLKWLASGAAVCGVSGIWAVATNSAIWRY